MSLISMAFKSNPITASARAVIMLTLKNISQGKLEIDEKFTGGEQLKFGSGIATSKDDLAVKLEVLSPWFYVRVLLHADIGLADSFMLEEFETDDLTGLLKLLLQNHEALNKTSSMVAATAGNFVHYLRHTSLANTLSNSSSNISAHYDIGNELFQSFLDDTMMYSSGVFTSPSCSLRDAQLNKLQKMINKAELCETDNVLEIGTGWGSFAIEAVKHCGCRVTTITLSKEQKSYAESKVLAELGPELAQNVSIYYMDYRKLPEVFEAHSFDKIISIEMMEAVGPEFLPLYFKICDKMLNKKHGRMVFQCITMPETRYEAYKSGVDFIQRYIFPGGHCPSVTAITDAVHSGSSGCFIMDELENIGPHYAPTLAQWRERFLQNFDKCLAPYPKTTLKTEYSNFGLSVKTKQVPFYSEEFKRKWVYYFCYCEAGFAMRSLGNVQVVLTREGNLGCAQMKYLRH